MLRRLIAFFEVLVYASIVAGLILLVKITRADKHDQRNNQTRGR